MDTHQRGAQSDEQRSVEDRVNDDGTEKWTRINVVRNPMNNDPSKIEMVSVNYDITELKMTERNLIEAKNKAEVSDRLKSAFLANMSHEIRTPLNAIVGFSNLLTETDDPEERRDYLRVVEENNDLLLTLISDILDLSKIEAGTFEFNYGPVDVNQMCEEVVRSLSLKMQGRPVELRFVGPLDLSKIEAGTFEFNYGPVDVNQMCEEVVRSLSLKMQGRPVELRFVGPGSPCFILGDKGRLTQVITNFINNAVKFTAEGSITLSYAVEGTSIRFAVEDTGSGIDKEHLDNIFERFVKLNSFVQAGHGSRSVDLEVDRRTDGRTDRRRVGTGRGCLFLVYGADGDSRGASGFRHGLSAPDDSAAGIPQRTPPRAADRRGYRQQLPAVVADAQKGV